MADYDLAILNATVIDGTGRPPRIADVGIRGDRIEHVGHVSSFAKQVIDAHGKVLAPGFVDIHGHSDYSLLSDPLARSKLHQGVTTEVEGNCGYHAAPVFGQVARERVRDHLEASGLVVDWTDTPQYLARLAEARPSINYARQIGYNTLRSAVTDDKATGLSPAERDRMRALVRREFELGALGLSYGLAYAPACFSMTEELVDVAEEAAAADGFISIHIRNEGDTLLESLEEALDIGRASHARVHISHLKTFGRSNWGKLEAAVTLLDAARARGLDVTVDRYPHLAMNTQLKFMLPVWVLEGGVEATKARLTDPASRERIVCELRSLDWEPREVLVALVGRPENKHLEGKFLDAAAAGCDPWEVACQLLAEEGDNAFGTFFGMNGENLDRILALDYAMVASDASVQAIEKLLGGGAPHPRCFDTFPYFLAEWAIARPVISLVEAIRKITSFPAHRAGLVDRGVIGEGSFADLVVLDLDALRPALSYEHPIRFPTGIDSVVVNGALALRGGRHLETRTGRLLGR